MQLGLHDRKAQQVRKTERFCKGKNDTQDSIPASWNLNELQRNFIESMFVDKKAK